MPPDETLLSWVALGVAGAALVAAGVLSLRLARLRRLTAVLQGRRRPDAGRAAEGGEDLDQFGFLRADIERLEESLGRAVQRVGMVRFDAFEDMGGQLSFSAALLDASGAGLVLTSINGRSETRIYAKPVEAGSSRYNLSDEEKEAIRRALDAPRR